jgi:HPt (histidine-containing phosphotransfer) domain-containing protein
MAAEPRSDDAVDRTVLDGLRALERAGTPDLVKNLVDCFLEETPRQLADLRDAERRGDAVRLARLAHKLKGSVANLGAHRMVQICGELETLGENGDIGSAPSLVADLEQQFDPVYDVLLSEVVAV